MQLSRRQFVSTTAVTGATLAADLKPASAAATSLPFIVVGDWGRRGHHDQRRVAVQMGKTAAAMDSRFTISIGDNFYENGVESVDDPQWQSSFEEVYTAPSLFTPWKVILGNHDYRGNVQAQLDYSHMSPRWRLPARYYADTQTLPDGAKADFFYVDTSPFIKKYYGSRVNVIGQDTDAQLAWLDRALTESTAHWKVVVGHHPIYTALSDDDGYDHDQPDLIARLNPLLLKHNIRIYICGHDHCLQSVKMDGITYVVSGAGSETYRPNPPIRGGFASGSHGFMAARLSASRLDYALVDMRGNALFAESVMNG